jgi:hypothetical protein
VGWPGDGGLDPAGVAGAVSRERSGPLLPEHGTGWFGRPLTAVVVFAEAV